MMGRTGRACHQAIRFRSWKNAPVGPLGGSVASHTMGSAPFSTPLGAEAPPMSVRTHPGSTQFTRAVGKATASITVIAFSAALEIE
jgi:hypothetical protein